jgi:hypothetical protein
MLREDLPPGKLIMGPSPYTITQNEIVLSAEAKEEKMKTLLERTRAQS